MILNVYIRKERAGSQELYVAQCQEMDLVAQATNIQFLYKKFIKILETSIVLNEEFDSDLPEPYKVNEKNYKFKWLIDFNLDTLEASLSDTIVIG